MKCKDCTIECGYRTSDGEKECAFQNHIIQVPDEWQSVRIQAAIAAMQGFITNGVVDLGNREDNLRFLVATSVKVANALVEELKKK